MPRSNGNFFSGKDYVTLGVAVVLAFVAWLIHNLSLTYSDIAYRTIVAMCEIDGHENLSSSQVEVAARCDMKGFSLIEAKINRGRARVVEFSPDDIHPVSSDLFYITKGELPKYFHEIFSDEAKLEYYVADTLFFRFRTVNCKKVSVNAVADLHFRSQYMDVNGLKLYPDSLLVYGTEEALEGVSRVNTEQFSLFDLKGETYGEVGVEPIRGVRIGSNKVGYSMDVVRFVERTITVPVIAKNVPNGVNFQIFPSEATIRLKSVFPGNDNYSRMRVVVDYNDYASSISGRCVGYIVDIPPRVLHTQVSPDVFDCIVIQNRQ